MSIATNFRNIFVLFPMKLKDAIALVNHPGITGSSPTTWADFGSGAGLFTNALAHLLMPGSKIYAIDKDPKAYKSIDAVRDVVLENIHADFTNAIPDISTLDGILMANSLHFVSNKVDFIKRLTSYFKESETFLIVEYDFDTANTWVPYPIRFSSLQKLFLSLQFHSVEKINELPSRYHSGSIYSAIVKR